jgi:Methyltransferase domain
VGFYGDQILPRLTNVLLSNRELREIRERVAAGLSGEVLEIGFGSGLNVPFYPPEVHRVLAVDPATVGRGLAAKRVAVSRVPVEYVGLDGASLPLDSESIDHVLITWTLCSSQSTVARLTPRWPTARTDSILFSVGGREAATSTARSTVSSPQPTSK